jgi:PAS domain S-box-containing protein
MRSVKKPRAEIVAENSALRLRLEEYEETLRAIGNGEVDAFVVSRPEGKQIFTLKGAEQPYRVLVETMNEGAANLSAEGTILYCNGRLASLLRVPLEQLMGNKLAAFVAPAYRSVFAHRLERGAQENGLEIQMLSEAGELVPVLLSFCSSELSGGRGTSVVLTDLTQQKRIEERKRAEEALQVLNLELESRVADRTRELAATIGKLKAEIAERESAEENLLRLNRLYLVLSETNHAIVRTKDRELLLKEICRVAVEDGGFRLAWVGLLNGSCGNLRVAAASGACGYLDDIGIGDAGIPRGIWPTAMSLQADTYCICNDFLGSLIARPWQEAGAAHGIASAASIPLKLEGALIGALTLYADEKDFFDQQQTSLLQQMGAEFSFALDNIHRETQRKEVERALYEQTEKRLQTVEALRVKEQMLVQQNRQAAMGEMIGNIAHQWRQPLNTLALAIQEVQMMHELGECSDEFMKQSAEKSMGLVQHMSQTIDDFRNYFKPDKEKTCFEVTEVIESTLLLIKDSFKHQRVKIEVVTHQSPVICGYRNEFAQSLLNILNNARDALTERKIEHPKVTVTVSGEGNRAVVVLADNAGGIPAEIIDKIFDPYFSTKGPNAGTGLGLFMAKTIVEKNLGGSLTVRNAGDGAEFRIEV